ncbi:MULTISPECIES: hypothetical protein [unclassified Nocardia]|uniref:hypothetical protein n=1 Tax=unclassified Nocardia TaxID=2637762 RepID=UPI001CE3EB96|nr:MULTISPECIES: hypothetical protein [unclassified Nocardia]
MSGPPPLPPQGGPVMGGPPPLRPAGPPPLPQQPQFAGQPGYAAPPVATAGPGVAPAIGIQIAPQPVPARQQEQQPAPEVADRAMLHRTELTRTYPCSACGGQLAFDIASQKLRCPNCGNYSEITAPNTPPQTRELYSAMAELRELQANRSGPQVSGQWEVVCQNCGGKTEFNGSLTATKCPYCATPIQRDDVHNAPARLPVDGLVPFRIDEKQARQLIEKWVTRRWFAPSDFKKYRRVGAFSSLYTAYFTYDADTSTWYEGERGDDYQVRVGTDDDGDPIYETRTNWYHVSGQVANDFADLPVLANDGENLDRKRIASLEPWPVDEARSYSPEFVAGHLCRTYDKDAEQSLPEAQQRMEHAIESTVRSDIGGDHQRIHNLQIDWRYLGFKHLLLPIWLLTVIYDEKPFQVYINGLTGQVSGDRPWSKVKIALAVLAAIVIVVVAIAIFSYLRAHGHSTSHSTHTRR